MRNFTIGICAAGLCRVIAEAADTSSGGVDACRIEAVSIVIFRITEDGCILFALSVRLWVAFLSAFNDSI
jgi:hypothetical protein